MLGRLIFEALLERSLTNIDTSFKPQKDVGVQQELTVSNEDSDLSTQFHVAMLSISLIVGLLYCGYVVYSHWYQNKSLLFYIKNLVVVLVCRTFFSLLIAAVVILGKSNDVPGSNTLIAFEGICLNLVLAFWLILTIYLHERVPANVNEGLNLKLYFYGIPAIAVYFAVVWTFVMANECDENIWVIDTLKKPGYQWIVSSLRLLYLIIQLVLLGDIVRLIMTSQYSFKNEFSSPMRKIGVVMAVLVLLFWLHFGFSVGRPPQNRKEPYLYFKYFLDGLQCAASCPLLYFLEKWGQEMLDNTSFTLTSDPKITDQRMPKQNKEVLISDLRSRMTATEPLNTALVGGKSKAETQDIVYSNIVSPERLQKTYELYKRFNGFSSSEVTIVAGEKFYECHDNITESVPKVIDSSHNSSETLIELKDLEKSSKVLGGVTKKNAFYTSKYLVVDSKGINIPKSLETRPSILSGQNPKDEGKNFLLGVNKKFSDEMIVKWLKDNSNNLGSI